MKEMDIFLNFIKEVDYSYFCKTYLIKEIIERAEFWWWLWYLKVILSCLISFVVGWCLINASRKICRNTDEQWKLSASVIFCPISVYFLLSIASRYGVCDRAVADGFSFGIVMGILSNLSTPPKGKKTAKLIAHQVSGSSSGKSHAVWLDSMDIFVGDARNLISEALHVVPASRVHIESGKGSFVDDLDAKLFPLLSGSSISVDFFGFTTVSCYIYIEDEELIPATINEDKSPRDQITHFRSLIGNIKGEARYGHHLTLTAKVVTANADVRGLFVSPVEKFAAAAPIHQLAIPSILSSAIHVRLLSWNAVSAAASPSEVGGSEFGDTNTVYSSASGNHPIPAPSLSRSRGIINSASRLYKSALEPSAESIRNGDLVVIESNGKFQSSIFIDSLSQTQFMSVTKGWWMGWSSEKPRRSGAFKIEILERNQNLFQNSLRNIKEQFETLGEKFTSSTGRVGSFSISNVLKETDNHLRAGDSFRLRSVKFPDYEMGVTSVKLKDEFCYVGLRKADDSSNGSKPGEEWCMPVRFSVKVSHLSSKMFKIRKEE